jgi:glutathione synthase/RimK-type ligase-like ATP-grasp enzyme
MKSVVHLMTMSPSEHGGNLSPSDALIWEELKQRGIEGTYFSPYQVSVYFQGEEMTLRTQECELRPEDILLVRLMRGAGERGYEVACAFEALGGTVSDPVSTLGHTGSKLLGYIKRHGHMAQQATVFFSKGQVLYEDISSRIKPPFIVKPQFGARGEGVSLVPSPEEFHDYIQQSSKADFLAQVYIQDIVREYRVVVVGGSAIGVVEKHKQEGHDPYQGMYDKDVPVVDDEVARLAEEAARIGGAHVYGADIVRTQSGQLSLLENNRCPDFVSFREATGIPVEKHIVDFITKE